MIRDAGPKDRDALAAFLTRRIDGAMFPLANLRAHGLGEGDYALDHDHAMRFWWVGDDSIVALTRGGMLMALLSGEPGLDDLRRVLAGQRVSGAIGPAASIRPVLDALGLADLPCRRDADEPGFGIDLSDLRVPDLPGAALVPASASLLPMLLGWRAAYHVEVLGTPEADAVSRATADLDGYRTRDSFRVLTVEGVPVAMTAFNATLPEIVQIGSVYTPPRLRSRGYARQAVALHLVEARAKGVRRAVLFAASEAATRAYLALGFRRTFPMALVLYPARVDIAP
jgi:GNAT superfamily N-acetyltransferase